MYLVDLPFHIFGMSFTKGSSKTINQLMLNLSAVSAVFIMIIPVYHFIMISSVKGQEPAADLSSPCCSGKMWMEINLLLKVDVKSKKPTPKPQIATLGLTGEQRNWWSFQVNVYSVMMLETIKLFVSVTEVYNILTANTQQALPIQAF